MTWLHGMQQSIPKLTLTPSQYLGAGLLALLLAISALFGQDQESQLTYNTPVQESLVATGDQSLPPAASGQSPVSFSLSSLLALNRQAAARVAWVGLAGGEGREASGAGREALARSAADWMERAAVSMSSQKIDDEFAARQRAILEQWQAALTDYDLSQVRAVSKANAELYAEMELGVRQMGNWESRD